MQRRVFIQRALTSLSAASLYGCASSRPSSSASKARVVVVGGGYGGASAAKFVRVLSNYNIEVVLIEPNDAFISCPLSNLVVSGVKNISDITRSYDALSVKHGVQPIKDWVASIDKLKHTVTLASGASISYDKLIVSPGVDMMWDSIAGSKAANESGQMVQAWKAGAETLALRRQLEQMRNGGTFAITIPLAPYRCPPAPYERASLIASYFKTYKPKSKVLILDANPDVLSEGALFKKFWAENYADILEYRPLHTAVSVDAKASSIQFEVQDDVHADVLNPLPAMRAGRIAVQSGLANMNGRWCGVNYQTFESTQAKDVYVIGDSVQAINAMPKSGHTAYSQAKIAAAAVVATLQGDEINANPMLVNTCYSFVSESQAFHIVTAHAYDARDKTLKPTPSARDVSAAPSSQDVGAAQDWANNIWADVLL